MNVDLVAGINVICSLEKGRSYTFKMEVPSAWVGTYTPRERHNYEAGPIYTGFTAEAAGSEEVSWTFSGGAATTVGFGFVAIGDELVLDSTEEVSMQIFVTPHI